VFYEALLLVGLGFGVGLKELGASLRRRGFHAELKSPEELVLLKDDAGDDLAVGSGRRAAQQAGKRDGCK
jgi:hypothetical protein